MTAAEVRTPNAAATMRTTKTAKLLYMTLKQSYESWHADSAHMLESWAEHEQPMRLGKLKDFYYCECCHKSLRTPLSKNKCCCGEVDFGLGDLEEDVLDRRSRDERSGWLERIDIDPRPLNDAQRLLRGCDADRGPFPSE